MTLPQKVALYAVIEEGLSRVHININNSNKICRNSNDAISFLALC